MEDFDWRELTPIVERLRAQAVAQEPCREAALAAQDIDGAIYWLRRLERRNADERAAKELSDGQVV
jgi:hypothetical protein